MAEPTAEMHDYMATVFKVDPRAVAAAAIARAVKDGGGEKKNGKAEAGKEDGEKAEEGHEFSHEFPIEAKKVKVAGGQLELTLGFVIELSCTVATDGAAGTSHFDPKGTVKALGRFLVGWTDQHVMAELSGGSGLFKSLKVEAGMSGIVCSAETDTRIGKFSLEFVVLKISVGLDKEKGEPVKGGKFTLEAAKASAKLVPHRVALPDAVIDGISIKKAAISLGASIELAPDWKKVLAKWAAKEGGKAVVQEVAKDAVAEGAELEAGEVAVAAVSAEAIVVTSFIAVSLATIAGTVYSLAQGTQIGDLAMSAKMGGAKARNGFHLAMAGYKQPSDPLELIGYQVGIVNRDAVFEKTRKAFPDAEEWDVRKAVTQCADAATAQAGDTIDKALRTGLWDGYLASNKRLLLHGDAEWAFVACFGNSPKDSDPEWKKYLDQHPTQSKF